MRSERQYKDSLVIGSKRLMHFTITILGLLNGWLGSFIMKSQSIIDIIQKSAMAWGT